MAGPVQENSPTGNSLKKQIAETQSGLTNIALFLIYVRFLSIVYFSTFTGYFSQNHYIAQN